MKVRIDTVASRDKLTPRRNAYWHRVRKGCYVGFRRMSATSEGTWLARAFDALTGKQIHHPLGDLSDLPHHQRFDAAQKSASTWFDHIGHGGSRSTMTVEDACSRYVDHLRSTRSESAANDAKSRLKNQVLSDRKLACVELQKLTPAHIEAWRKNLRDTPTRSGGNRGQLRSASTLNRDMSGLRAVLNLAYADGHVMSDFAWRRKLLPIKNAGRRRELYLDRTQRIAFVENAEPDLALFLRGLCLLPLRPGALAALKVADYDARLKVLLIGKDKHGGDRKIKLPDTTAGFFANASKSKLPNAPLLCRSNGKAWNKDAWKWPVKSAAAEAKLPAETTAYTLRHSVISDLVHGGLDLLTVAQISGTSVVMIERHYGHLRSDIAAGALARLAL